MPPRPWSRCAAAAVVVATLLVAACGSGPSASPTAPASAAPTPIPTTAPPASSAASQPSTSSPEPTGAPSAPASGGPSAAPSGGPSAAPDASSGGHDAPDLEALLPDLFGTLTLEKGSVAGTNAVGDDPTGQVITSFLASHGRTLADLSVAQASDPSGTADITFVAFRVTGVDAPTLMTAIVTATQASDPEVAVSQVAVGGRQVTRIDAEGRIRILYFKNGVVFGISAGSQDVLDQAETVMP